MAEFNCLYIGDKNYFKYASASIYSLLENNQHLDEITIYYVDDNISESYKEKLEETVSNFGRRIIWIPAQPINEILEKSRVPKYKGTYAIYYRWFCYDYLDEGDKLFYIDSDIIIVEKVDELIRFDMCDKPLAMCRDNIYDYYMDYLGLRGKEYFNTGVIVFDVSKCKELKIKEQFSNFLSKNKRKLLYGEQDVASILYNDCTAVLNANMNVYANYMAFSTKNFYKALSINRSAFYSPEEVDFAKSHPIIKHCSAFFGFRPWYKETIHPYSKEFDEFFKKAGYDENDKVEFKNSYIKKCVYHLPEPLKPYVYALLSRININNLLRMN